MAIGSLMEVRGMYVQTCGSCAKKWEWTECFAYSDASFVKVKSKMEVLEAMRKLWKLNGSGCE